MGGKWWEERGETGKIVGRGWESGGKKVRRRRIEAGKRVGKRLKNQIRVA